MSAITTRKKMMEASTVATNEPPTEYLFTGDDVIHSQTDLAEKEPTTTTSEFAEKVVARSHLKDSRTSSMDTERITIPIAASSSLTRLFRRLDVEAQEAEDRAGFADESSVGTSTRDSDWDERAPLPLPATRSDDYYLTRSSSSAVQDNDGCDDNLAFALGSLLESFQGNCNHYLGEGKAQEKEILFDDPSKNASRIPSSIAADLHPAGSTSVAGQAGARENNLFPAKGREKGDWSSTTRDQEENAVMTNNVSATDEADCSGKDANDTENPSPADSENHTGSREDNVSHAGQRPPRRTNRALFMCLFLFPLLGGTIGGTIYRILSDRNDNQESNALNTDSTAVTNATSSPTSSPSNMITSFPAESFTTLSPSSLPSDRTTTISPTLRPTQRSTTLSPTTPPPMSSAPSNNNSTNSSGSTPYIIPPYPMFRFVPWTDVPSFHQGLAARHLSYNSTSWNSPGTANVWDLTQFWEGQSFSTIQLTSPDIGVISTIATLGFTKDTWDCWVNHYQNFTWSELDSLAPIEITFINSTTREDNVTSDDGSVIIGGRDIQQAMTTLGWTAELWSSTERFRYFFPLTGERPLWDNLSPMEQDAATQLCFTRELWDRIPIPEWSNNR